MAAQSYLLFLFVIIFRHLALPTRASNADDYLHKACSVTRYRALCIRSLSTFGHGGIGDPSNPSLWARAAVSVTLAETERVWGYLSHLDHQKWAQQGGRRARAALSDCVECFGDAVAELHSALFELRRLQRGTFQWQMSNVETFVSAALTNQNTCLDGFAEAERIGVAAQIGTRVLNTTHFASNALALVNSLAASGGVH